MWGFPAWCFILLYIELTLSFSRNVFDMNSWWWPLKNVKHNKNIEFEGKKGPFVGPYFVLKKTLKNKNVSIQIVPSVLSLCCFQRLIYVILLLVIYKGRRSPSRTEQMGCSYTRTVFYPFTAGSRQETFRQITTLSS
jgi:hypothetical protein